MQKTATQALSSHDRALDWALQVAVVVGASLFVALCAQVTLPLPFNPVPLTLQNFGVLLVGLTLGSRRSFAALALYLVEGAVGMPVFNPAGHGGVAPPFGPTCGDFLGPSLFFPLGGWGIVGGRGNISRAC